MSDTTREPGLFWPQVSSIASNTFKEAVRSRIFYVLLAFALCLFGFSTIVGFMAVGTLGRVILDMGLATTSFFSSMTAMFVGVGLIYREVERKTIYNILAKPIPRSRFILGRYVGLMSVLFVNMVVMVAALSLLLLAFDGFKLRIIAAAGYMYLELMLLTAVAVFFSSLTSPAVSALCTGAFFIIGHTSATIPELLVPRIQTPWLQKAAVLLYHLLPDLNYLNINNMVVHDLPEGIGFTIWAVLYACTATAVLLLLATFFFRRRDLV